MEFLALLATPFIGALVLAFLGARRPTSTSPSAS